MSRNRFGRKGIQTEEIFTTWELEKEKQEVAFWEDVLRRLNESSSGAEEVRPEEILVVGDELNAFVCFFLYIPRSCRN
jgi:hypothetical protein